MMHCGYSNWIIETMLVLTFVLGGINLASAFYTLTPVTGIVVLDTVIGFVVGSVVSVAALLGVLLLAAVLVEALFQGILFVGERMVKQ